MAKKGASIQKIGLSLVPIEPVTNNQAVAFQSDKHLVLHGLAGTGKTFISLFFAFEEIESRLKDKVIIIRSAVPTRDIGFLPGNLAEKASVYEEPYKDICSILFDRGDAYELLRKSNICEFMTTSFTRGITLRNAVVIVDECQNMSFHELDSIITRLGHNCRIIFCGDFRQADLKNNTKALEDFMSVLEAMEDAEGYKLFTTIDFGVEDIVRDEFVKSYLITKDRLGL